MEPTDLIKGKTYLLGSEPGKEIKVTYIRHILNFRVFKCDSKIIELDETSTKKLIKEYDQQME